MQQTHIIEMARQGMVVATMVTLPILAVSLFCGLAVSVFQAITQVQEMTLTYVPKLIGAGIVFLVGGSWMMTTLVTFMRMCFEQASKVVH